MQCFSTVAFAGGANILNRRSDIESAQQREHDENESVELPCRAEIQVRKTPYRTCHAASPALYAK